LNERIAAGDVHDDGRVITGRPVTIAAAFAAEAPTLMPLPVEAFDPARQLETRVDNRARVSVRQCFYSVPARFAGRRLPIRLAARCLDELGYVQIDPRGAELLFQIITEREERASIAIAIATNLPFSEWGSVFPDPRLVAAIVDRVTFNAHILETGTQSYRLRTSKTTARRKRAG
jgi:hypothetical protein